MAIRMGSWGTPELGLSELAAKLLGEKFTSQGGSDLSRSWANQTYTPPQQTPTITDTKTPTKTTVAKSLTAGSPVVTNNIPNNPQPQSSTPSVPDYSAQINAMYDPAMRSLNDAQSFLNQQKVDAEAGALSTRDHLQTVLDRNLAQGDADVANQQSIVYEGHRSALGDALASYNSQQQQLMSRYGMGTGAGSFMSDILGQEKLKGDYSLQKSYQDALTQIVGYQQKLHTAISDQVWQIEDDYKKGLKEISANFFEKNNQINLQRGQIESAKAQNIYENMKQATDAAKALQARKEEVLWNLDLYQKTENAKVTSVGDSLVKQYAKMQLDNAQNVAGATTAQSMPTTGGTTNVNTRNTVDTTKNVLNNPFLTDSEDPEQNPWDIAQFFNPIA